MLSKGGHIGQVVEALREGASGIRQGFDPLTSQRSCSVLDKFGKLVSLNQPLLK